ncbi:hypothetical protein BRN44_16825, partial [Xanthomonas oryzae pv. oryzae]
AMRDIVAPAALPTLSAAMHSSQAPTPWSARRACAVPERTFDTPGVASESGISLKQGRQQRFSGAHLRMVEGARWR